MGRASSRRASGASCPGFRAPIERDLGPALAAVWALYEGTFKDVCVMDWTQEQATMELTATLKVISLGHPRPGARAPLPRS